MKKVGIILMFCTLMQPLWAQEQKSTERQAATYYIQYDYARAANLYKRLAGKKKVQLLTLERLADSYRKINAYADAAVWYGKLVTMPDALPEDGLYYGDMLKSLGRYEDAKIAYQQYAQKTGHSQRVANRIAGCDSALIWLQHPTRIAIRNLQQLNTAKSDWGATYYPQSVVFMSDSLYRNQLQRGSRINKNLYGRSKHPYYKLYRADSINYGNVMISDLSDAFNQYQYHIGPVAFNQSYDTAYFTVTNPQQHLPAQKEKIKPVVIYGTRRLELFISNKDNQGKWTAPVAFAYNKPEEYSLGHAALSNDGSTLYFATDMPGGQGGTDIWFSQRQANGSWGALQNCGAVINTSDDEAFPTIAPDGNLYFSSKGLPGMGGFDIFKATGSSAQWNIPENLHYPLNTGGDDFYLISGQNGEGFFASNRSGGRGDDDIYGFIRSEEDITPLAPPALQIPFEGIVCPGFRGACIYLYNRQRGIGWCFVPGPDGKFGIMLERETDYVVRIINTNGTKDSTEFNTRGITGSELLSKAICPEKKFVTGSTFLLQNLYYDYNRWNIRPDAAIVLDSLANILLTHPRMRIELGAHTDSRGKPAYNRMLSQKRAEAAVQYLAGQGVARQRMIPKGYGASKLLNRCEAGVKCSDAEHEQNRRTEIKILGQ